MRHLPILVRRGGGGVLLHCPLAGNTRRVLGFFPLLFHYDSARAARHDGFGDRGSACGAT